MCSVAHLLVREEAPLLKALVESVPSLLLLWLVVMVMSVLVRAALAPAGRQAVVTILPLSRSLLVPSCRSLRSWQSFSSLLEAFLIALVGLRI